MSDFLISISAFFIIVLIMVIVHELGHFAFARLYKVKVDVFAVGFGHTVWSRVDKYGTEWKINALPLGGYVKMFGDAGPASNPDNEVIKMMTEEEKNVSFFHKKLWQKAIIVLAGPLMNYVLAFFVMLSLTIIYGDKEISNTVGAVEENSPAAHFGILPGDTILAINQKRISNFLQIREILAVKQDNTNVDILLDRQGKEINISVQPTDVIEPNGETKYKIGVIAAIVDVQYSLGEAILHAGQKFYFLNILMIDGVFKLLTGHGSKDDLGGPIKIAQISGEAAREGVHTFLNLLVLLSLNLGLINLIPIPGLDGGHLMYYTINAITGKPIPQKIQELGFKLGFVALILLLVFITYNDVLNLFK